MTDVKHVPERGSPTDMPQDKFKDAINFLKGWEDGANWAELKFTESHLGNINTLRSYVEHALNDRASPIYRGAPISEDVLNEIGRAIRQLIRSEIGLPAIASAELSSWSFDPKPPRRFEGPSVKVTTMIPISNEHYSNILFYIENKYPKALPFRSDVIKYAETQDGKSLPIDGSYFEGCLINALYHLFPLERGQMWAPIDVIRLRDFIDEHLTSKALKGAK